MTGLDRLIGHRLKRHDSPLILKEHFAGLTGRAAGGENETEQGQQNRET
jgi:hypothetical protein